MNIAENILKHNLKNVYFLTGTPCGGKTTISKELSKKYGFIHFNDNWHEDHFKIYREICEEKYQKHSTKKKYTTDWETYFSRSVDEFLADNGDYGEFDEYLEFVIIELIKISQNQKIIADVGFPIKTLTEISEYNRIACLLAPPELVTCANYGQREDHREFLECIMALKEPDKKIKTQNELFKINVEKVFADVKKYNLFGIVRNEENTLEKTLSMLEKHFNL